MKRILLFSFALITGLAIWIGYPHREVDFNTQVKPVINKNCIICHGGVRRKSGFSLLFRQDALAPAESGKPAIVPGRPDESEMIRRLTLTDIEERMPFKHPPLSSDEINTLRQWIKEGAKWGDHWAYVAVKPVVVPEPSWFDKKTKAWAKNEIDFFISDKWKEKKLAPSPEADKLTILRRVSLDLTGLSPTEKIAAQFLSDSSAQAYENLVDALLASPRYGEQWTALWLDLARYADTKGYERDYSRTIWRYRDWLIRAFNENKPYDEFITEQLAGDLFPDPTDDQLVATAFHRNTMTNDEGGTENEEFRTAAVLDRVNTTWEALMGTTFGCTQCHSHPYDPFRHDEYYKFVAFFNNTRDEDTYADYPLLVHFAREDSARLEKLKAWISQQASEQKSNEVYQFVKTGQPSINSLQADHFINSELNDTKWLIFRNHAVSRLPHVHLTGKNRLIYRFMSFEKGGVWTLHLDTPDGPVLTKVVHGDTKGKWTIALTSLAPAAGEHALYFTYENPYLKKPGDNGMMFDWFYFTEEFPGKGRPGYDSAQASFWKLMNAKAETTPIMMENPPSMKRKSFVFERGNWLVKGKEVQPGTPHSLLPFPADMPANRLGLARWITSKEHPLTARTLVNRLWEQLFGTGLAETLEDLGTQGVAPTHPQLLDYLAWQFMNDDHWKIKALLKTMVMSATYRQDSRLSDVLAEKDPNNKYYARGPRVRLSAEQVRDQTLAVSGLLSAKMYGPSVMPYQPKGIWQSPYNELKWKISKGEDSYRRAIYTYWKRTNPYPSMILFDGMAREVCTARRIRTNTPLQALVTLNDSVYVEAARNFARRILQEAPGPVRNQIQKAYSLAIGKPISEEKLHVLLLLYDKTSTKFRKASTKNRSTEDPALELVASVILNLDEFITKN
jgi:hypothetical protein